MRERVEPVHIFDDDEQRFFLRLDAQTIFEQGPQRALPIFRFEILGKVIVGNFKIEQNA